MTSWLHRPSIKPAAELQVAEPGLHVARTTGRVEAAAGSAARLGVGRPAGSAFSDPLGRLCGQRAPLRGGAWGCGSACFAGVWSVCRLLAVRASIVVLHKCMASMPSKMAPNACEPINSER